MSCSIIINRTVGQSSIIINVNNSLLKMIIFCVSFLNKTIFLHSYIIFMFLNAKQYHWKKNLHPFIWLPFSALVHIKLNLKELLKIVSDRTPVWFGSVPKLRHQSFGRTEPFLPKPNHRTFPPKFQLSIKKS